LRWLLLFLLLLLLGLQYRLWFAEGSLAERSRLERQVQSQTEINHDLQARNAVLEREVLELQTGNSTLEQRAREQLGLVRKGETYYQIVEPIAGEQVVAGPADEKPDPIAPSGLDPAAAGLPNIQGGAGEAGDGESGL
jgi:cell division protein FtsB